ncbi:MAG: NAD(P)H-dependent oxidoreductase [Candidatus Omnitrophota bacterium]
MNIAIIFHSVCGNNYLVARKFEEELKGLGASVVLLRTPDQGWTEKSGLAPDVQANLRAMRAVPIATGDAMLKADRVIMGSPTYFGNVSASMKAFMDSTGKIWVEGGLSGKKFAAFTSAGNTEGGGDLCLQALHTYAQYMGMLSVPMPVTVVPEHTNALGIIHYSQGKYAEALDPLTSGMIKGFSSFLMKV